ncbi:hypothetical protein F4781DRAFT_402106 [Annulohypoxylon bovei var. microspora]|nr:hypothetical protein F4781DRAFT_402106 [Annulohypoxylon bovei var. microspora]
MSAACCVVIPVLCLLGPLVFYLCMRLCMVSKREHGRNNSDVRLSICRVTNLAIRRLVRRFSRSFAKARRRPPRHLWTYTGRFGTSSCY